MNSVHERRLRPILRALCERERQLRDLVADERSLLDADGEAQTNDPASDDADRADRGTRIALESGMIDHYLNEIADVAAARERIRSGTFGICVDCGEPIDDERLQALPSASRCMICQRRRERLLGH